MKLPLALRLPRFGPRRGEPPAREAFLAVRLGEPIFYRLSEEGVREIEQGAIPPGAPIAVFDEFDVRAAAERSLGEAGARRLAARAAGERLWIVNRSRDLGAVYGRAPVRIREFGRPLIPGAEIADLVAFKAGIERRGAVVGFDLGRSPRLAILYGYRADGEQCPSQFAVDPHDVELFVAEYARANGVKTEGPARLFGEADLLQAMAEARAYPLEESHFGIPRSRLYAGASAAGFAAAAIALAAAAWQWRQAAALAEEASAQEMEAARLRQEVAMKAAGSVEGLAAAASLDAERIAELAAALWSPGARVAAAADAAGLAFSVRLYGWQGSGSITSGMARPEAVREALGRAAPPGLQRTDVRVDGRLHGIVIEYRAPSGLGLLGARAHD